MVPRGVVWIDDPFQSKNQIPVFACLALEYCSVCRSNIEWISIAEPHQVPAVFRAVGKGEYPVMVLIDLAKDSFQSEAGYAARL